MFSARCFIIRRKATKPPPLVQALLTDDWQAQWPLDAEALAPVAAMFKTHSYSRCHRPRSSAPFIGSYALPSPPWVPSIDRESIIYDSTLALRQRMLKTEFSLKCNKTSQKIILGRCCCWRPLAENDRHHECANNSPAASVSVVVPLRRIYRSMPGIRFIRR